MTSQTSIDTTGKGIARAGAQPVGDPTIERRPLRSLSASPGVRQRLPQGRACASACPSIAQAPAQPNAARDRRPTALAAAILGLIAALGIGPGACRPAMATNIIADNRPGGVSAEAIAQFQSWPSRPVRLIVPFAPGGAADRIARVTAEQLSAAFGQTFIADNRPGAGGSVGYELLWRAAPDGYTLGTAGDSATLPPLTQKGVRWDPRQYSAISLLTVQPLVLAVHPSVPAKTLQEFIAHARAKPGTLSFGSSGHGHPQHLTGEWIRRVAGFDMVHVPYKGGGAAITDLVGGQIPVVVLGSSPVIPFHRAGKARILAVTSARRSATLPDVPTLAEAGVPGIDVVQWIGLVGPPKLSPLVVRSVNAAVVKSMQTPAARDALESVGFEVATSTPEQMATRFRDTMASWSRLLKELKLSFD